MLWLECSMEQVLTAVARHVRALKEVQTYSEYEKLTASYRRLRLICLKVGRTDLVWDILRAQSQANRRIHRAAHKAILEDHERRIGRHAS